MTHPSDVPEPSRFWRASASASRRLLRQLKRVERVVMGAAAEVVCLILASRSGHHYDRGWLAACS